MITQLDCIGVAALIICPPIVIFAYLLAWGLCKAAARGEEQGEREWEEWMTRRGNGQP